ncbi:MAG: CHAD domain-containing protein, partial [Thaumarchaeota archaeon]|nr:CHAD domain-containing protein [Nitrososphaerota archaeon]
MKKSMINKNTFLRKFKKISDNFCQKLEKYIADSNDENIHDIRVSIRRLETSYRILPKNIRKQERIREYVKYAKKLFKINAKIRDYDIICANMELHHSNKTKDLVS